MAIAIFNFVLIAILGASPGISHDTIDRIISNPAWQNAVASGDPLEAEAIIRETQTEQFCQILKIKKESSQKVWTLLVSSNGIDLAKRISDLSPSFLALSIAHDVLQYSTSELKANRAKALQQKHILEKLQLTYKSLPALFDLALSNEAKSISEQAKALRKQHDELAQKTSLEYDSILRDFRVRAGNIGH